MQVELLHAVGRDEDLEARVATRERLGHLQEAAEGVLLLDDLLDGLVLLLVNRGLVHLSGWVDLGSNLDLILAYFSRIQHKLR